MNSYEAESSNVSVEYVDVDRFPIRAREYDVAQYGTVVVEYMGRKERATTDEERDITTALIKAVNPATKKVYFLAGHGERDVNGPADEQGLSADHRRPEAGQLRVRRRWCWRRPTPSRPTPR